MQIILTLVGGIMLVSGMFASTLAIDSPLLTTTTKESTATTTETAATSTTTSSGTADGTTETVSTETATSLNTTTTEPLRTTTTNTLDHPAPLVAFSASLTSVASGGGTTLTWNSRNATSCSAGGAWRGVKPVSGTQLLTNLTVSGIYELTCTGLGGSVSRNVGVKVMAATNTTAPVLSNTAEPIRTTTTKEFYYPDRPATTTPLPLRILPPRIASTTRMEGGEEPTQVRTLESVRASSSPHVAPAASRVPVAADPSEIRRKMRALMDRTADNGLRDSDSDGISDYDEVHLYGTDPKNQDTNSDGLSDRDEVISGRDPIQKNSSDTVVTVTFEDPRRGGQVRTDLLVVAEVRTERHNTPPQPSPSATSTATSSATTSAATIASTTLTSPVTSETPISVHGRTAPNALVTVYIFSTPTIVVVKADKDGNWSYTLTKELPDGKHEVYAAITDNRGNIVAKSQPVSFVKQAAALTVTGVLPPSDVQDPALFSAFTMTMFGVLMGFVLAGLLLYFGQRYRRSDENILYIGPDNNYGEDTVKQSAPGPQLQLPETREDPPQKSGS